MSTINRNSGFNIRSVNAGKKRERGKEGRERRRTSRRRERKERERERERKERWKDGRDRRDKSADSPPAGSYKRAAAFLPRAKRYWKFFVQGLKSGVATRCHSQMTTKCGADCHRAKGGGGAEGRGEGGDGGRVIEREGSTGEKGEAQRRIEKFSIKGQVRSNIYRYFDGDQEAVIFCGFL